MSTPLAKFNVLWRGKKGGAAPTHLFIAEVEATNGTEAIKKVTVNHPSAIVIGIARQPFHTMSQAVSAIVEVPIETVLRPSTGYLKELI